MDSALERFSQVVDRIDKAAQRSGRDPRKIALVAVSKSVPFDRIDTYFQTEIRIFGENRVQEAVAKFGDIQGKKLPPGKALHLIGHLQSNKAKKAAGFFDMVQSLDTAELGEDLNRHAGEAKKRL